MERFNQFIVKFSRFLQLLTIIAMALLGICLSVVLFVELFNLSTQLLTVNLANDYFKILDNVIVFFLFFEFVAMIISALKHNGHISVNFLMSLGVTALLRWLIATHGDPIEIVLYALAILLLIVGMVILNRFIK
ncbi:phosphate-starvation-inducible protein PsiE [Limosilactobacillus sp. STM2_1]|uniref:Protein PsiE n=1 Tax=Limosilactobacillus rudii TaxID=2759755 RepID=A0A7W3YNB6_9LACO|nr:phosphate-starvation-inducible protein PsiE [Limosilactobacillus rudii]MBB1079232.1 phosphate-starvation-inducible protein PsiE [Limosilactobacillus rudii]MBB1097321.1 phosphate-starvation-inducible protein PsiE [Limosilactobacillus rudii]MCD7134430.1 phosphate-starvation-inducible protein PsiE [Limosilactobacillus rudii]